LLLANTIGVTEAGLVGSEAVRFRGFVNGGSDKDLVTVTRVPEPATMLLFGTAMVGAGLRRYRGSRT
jgi:hypothetical protein